MKKIVLIFLSFILIISTASCEFQLPSFNFGDNSTEGTVTPDDSTEVPMYDILFYTFGMGVEPEKIEGVTEIPNDLPDFVCEGYTFEGWYYDVDFTKPVVAGDPIISKIVLYAKIVKDSLSVTPTEEYPVPPTILPTEEPEVTPTPDNPTFDDTGKLSSSETCNHNFYNNVCRTCNTDYDSQVFNIFKSTTIIYDNDDTNPYNVNLDSYGSDIKVIFYEPDTRRDPYSSTSSSSFYSNYEYAKTYEEAYHRTNHHFMSGDITNQGYLTPTGKVMSGASAVRCTTSIYILDSNGEYIGYIPNSLDGNNHVIWYGGAYISFNDVAAYLYAFGEVPANSNYDKGTSGRKESVSDWGKYGRCNIGEFYANTSKYPFQPAMIRTKSQKYTETDFGTQGGYTNTNTITGTHYNQGVYNNGSSINRGAARFCFVDNKKSVDDRFVFYTYNHYNDFQEYLNYEDGFGVRFGNMSAGNQYCGNKSDYEASNQFPITQYQSVVYKNYLDLLKLI